jgi:DNA replication protein DnaC
MGSAQIKNVMAELKLEGMLRGLDQTLQEAQKEGWSPTDLLDQLLQQEYDFREQRTIERRLLNAKLKTKPGLEDFDFTAKRNITREQIKELYHLKWLEVGRPLLLMGPTGIGKTFFAQALGVRVCSQKKTVLFMSISNLFEHQMLARASGTYLKFRDKLTKPDCLILDDFGHRKLLAQEAHDFCELLEERGADKSTVITTQLPLDHWAEVIEDAVIADSIIDRLIHSSLQVILKGESYRKVKAKKMEEKSLEQKKGNA